MSTMIRRLIIATICLETFYFGCIEAAKQNVQLSESYLPVAMQVIAHLTDQMAFEIKEEATTAKPTKPTTKPTTPKPLDVTTPFHRPGYYAPSAPPKPSERIKAQKQQQYKVPSQGQQQYNNSPQNQQQNNIPPQNQQQYNTPLQNQQYNKPQQNQQQYSYNSAPPSQQYNNKPQQNQQQYNSAQPSQQYNIPQQNQQLIPQQNQQLIPQQNQQHIPQQNQQQYNIPQQNQQQYNIQQQNQQQYNIPQQNQEQYNIPTTQNQQEHQPASQQQYTTPIQDQQQPYTQSQFQQQYYTPQNQQQYDIPQQNLQQYNTPPQNQQQYNYPPQIEQQYNTPFQSQPFNVTQNQQTNFYSHQYNPLVQNQQYPQQFGVMTFDFPQYNPIQPQNVRSEEPLLSAHHDEVKPLLEPTPDAPHLLPPHFESDFDKISSRSKGFDLDEISEDNLQYLSKNVREMIRMAHDPHDDRLVDVWDELRANPAEPSPKGKLSSSNLRLLLLYDLLSREAKRQRLSDYSGFSPDVMKTLVESSSGGAREQLRMALSKMVDRHDCEHEYANNRAKEMVAELAKDESKLSTEIRYLQPLVYKY